MYLFSKLFEREPSRPAESWARKLVDPENTLPEISLSRPDTDGIRNIILAGNRIGEVCVSKYRPLSFDMIRINERRGSRRPPGSGLATYLWVIEEAINIGDSFGTNSSGKTSEDAVHIWRILARVGVATVNKDFEQVEEGKYIGNYRVYPRK